MVVVAMNHLEVVKSNNAEAQQRQYNDLDCAYARRQVLSAIVNPHGVMLRTLAINLIGGITLADE